MSGKILIWGEQKSNLVPYIELLQQQGQVVEYFSKEQEKELNLAHKVSQDNPRLVLVDGHHPGIGQSVDIASMPELSTVPFVGLFKKNSNLSNVLLATSFSWLDDLLFLPIARTEFLNRVHCWYQLSDPEAEVALPKASKRTAFLQFQMQIIEQLWQQKNLGRVEKKFYRLERLLETLSGREQEVAQIRKLRKKLHHIWEHHCSPLQPKIAEIDLSPLEKETRRALDALEEHLKEQERVTMPMLLKDFLEGKEEEEREASPEYVFPEQEPISVFDEKLARRLLQRKVISQEQLQKAIYEQKHTLRYGKNIPLCSVMLLTKIITPKDVQRVFGQESIATLYCPSCQVSYRVLNIAHYPPENFSCRICSQPLTDQMEESELLILPDDNKLDKMLSEKEEEIDIEVENISRLLEQASFLTKYQQFDKAMRIYHNILQKFPKDEDTHLGITRTYIEAGRYQEALDKAEKICQRNPQNSLALSYRAVANYYTGNLDEAISDATTLLTRQIHTFTALSTRGKAYFRKKEHHQAIDDLNGALELVPDFVKGYLYRGKAYLLEGEYGRALADFKESLRVNPRHPNYREVKKIIDYIHKKSLAANE